jgi:ubiquinone/menaquinone biosynthesis C-methylase UbiE
MNTNKEIKRDAQATKIFDDRSIESDYRTLIPVLKEGMRVLDVGCGTGAISLGIAKYVGETGHVTGIDNTEKFIASGKESYQHINNLDLIHVDLFSFQPEQKFDLIVAARVLQWLNNPQEALRKMKGLLNPDGQVSILDYNHTALEWKPAPPKSMQDFYQVFLDWRANAGMNNSIAEHLEQYFIEEGFQSIEVLEADEVYVRGQEKFKTKVGIWSKVAGLKQIVEEGFLKEEDRLKVIAEYDAWVDKDAEMMVMKLKEVRGRIGK